MKTSKIVVGIVSVFSALACIYIYRPHGLYFLADDFIHIPESAENLLTQRNSLRPLGNISLHLDFIKSNTSAFGYHLTNLILHCFNSILVYFVAGTLAARYAKKSTGFLFPLLSAVFFFTYPFHSEAVFWIIGRSGQLGTLFLLPAIILFIRRHQSIFYFIASTVCFELALLSYESSWIFPLLVLLVTRVDRRLQESGKRDVIYILVVVAVFSTHLFFRYQLTNEVFNKYDTASFISLDIPSLLLNFLRLVSRTFLPPFINTKYLILSFLLIVILITAVVFANRRRIKRDYLILLLSCSWLISYLPYLSLGIDTHGVEGERYLYMPSVFFCILFMYCLHVIGSKHVMLVAFVAIIIFNSFYLYESRRSFAKASLITSGTFTEIRKLTGKNEIFVEGLPQYNRGAVIFRLGLEEGIKWLVPSAMGKVKVVSIDDSDIKVRSDYTSSFNIQYVRALDTTPVKLILQKEASVQKIDEDKRATSLIYNPGVDARLRFSENILLVEK